MTYRPNQLDFGELRASSVMNTVAEIKTAIERLSPAEQSDVIQFIFALAWKRPLTPEELVRITQRLVESENPVEVEMLKSALVAGFYGEVMPEFCNPSERTK